MGSLASFQPCTGDEPFLDGKSKALLVTFPSEIQFGNTPLGVTSNEATIMVRNDGHDAVAVTAIEAVGDFAYAGSSIAQILAGETVSLTVTFTPSKAGELTGGLHIAAAEAQGNKFVKLVGTGVLAPAELPQFHQLVYEGSHALSAVNITEGVYGLVASGVFAGAVAQLQHRASEEDPWVDITGATLSSGSESVFGIPLTSGQVRLLIGGGTVNTNLNARLVW